MGKLVRHYIFINPNNHLENIQKDEKFYKNKRKAYI